ncbi:MAG: hypothetical protein K0Q79_199 [Flavipsychrobacter sp.]|jgi:predicted nuclease of restriction endonuclease-like (RecB) superfamily|nr:hypothetical protein [Flavipsychrobacter sp.]
MKLDSLISQINSLDGALKHEATKAVNRLLTIRNWLIGYYIVEYEQNGEDRAKYGDNLLNILSDSLSVKGLSETNLKINRSFYLAYPVIAQPVLDELKNKLMGIRQTVSDEFKIENQSVSNEHIHLNEQIINNLFFSHIILLLSVPSSLQRTFYAIEAIKCTWSVRELKRQINSLLFERSNISKEPEKLLVQFNGHKSDINHASFIKDVYTFEFLGLPARDAVEEHDLETALLDHLQQFLLEMGHGFCLEARQKRILIGNEYFFIDLVFYHRILKCHVLIDLKVEEFDHNKAGQLNTYINYYKKEVQLTGDNPPIGILMVTNKNDALVEYATAGMDEQLFVRKYMLELPDKKQIEAFIKKELRNL